MGMISEFKEFAGKGNLVDMAVGFVMGSAFATVVTSFIEDIFLPLISPLMGGLDLSTWNLTIKDAVLNGAGEVIQPAVQLGIGKFLTALISFLIVALVMFMIIRGMNKVIAAKEAAPPADEVLLAEIRDLLKSRS